jgi:hypothetical protein
MTTLPRVVGIAALAGFLAAPASAQERALERLEITMELLPAQAVGPEEITRRIELPPAANQGNTGDQPPAELPGLENGNGQGLETATEARERGREFGQDVAEQARENRENAGRGDDPPGPPEDPPGPPADPGNGGGSPDSPPGRPTP